MDPIQTAIHAMLAAVVAALLVAAGRAINRRFAALSDMSLVGPALAIAVLWQFLIQEGPPAWPFTAATASPPAPKWHSLVWTVGAVGIGSVLLVPVFHRRSSARPRVELATGLAVIVAATVLTLLRSPAIGTINPAHIAAALALFLVPAWTLVARPDRSMSLGVAIIFSFAALAGLSIEAAHFAKLGTIAATAAGASLAIAATAWWLRLHLSPLAAVAALVTIGTTATVGAPYARETPGWLWVVPAVAPLLVVVSDLPFIRPYARTAAVLRYALPAVVAMSAVALAVAMAATNDEGEATTTYGAYGS
jgi:hypothetical protein